MHLEVKHSFLSFQLLKSGHHRLVLRDVDLKSSGTYSCQITLSGPPFHTEQRDKNLTVISKSFDFVFILLVFWPRAKADIEKCPSLMKSRQKAGHDALVFAFYRLLPSRRGRPFQRVFNLKKWGLGTHLSMFSPRASTFQLSLVEATEIAFNSEPLSLLLPHCFKLSASSAASPSTAEGCDKNI